MPPNRKQQLADSTALHRAFLLSISLKAFNGVLEILGGFTAFFVSKEALLRIALFLSREELREDPGDPIAQFVIHSAQAITPSSQQFATLYLLVHGFLKLLLVQALLRKRLWAYPAAIVVFFLFTVYQTYTLIRHPGIGLFALTLLDAAIVLLTFVEYRQLRRNAQNRQDKPVISA